MLNYNNRFDSKKYHCPIVEMYGPAAVGKSYFSEIIKEQLKKKGFKIAIIQDATEAYLKKLSKTYDLIILDELPIKRHGGY